MIQISGGKSALWWEQKRQMSGGKSDKLGGGKSNKGKWTTTILAAARTAGRIKVRVPKPLPRSGGEAV